MPIDVRKMMRYQQAMFLFLIMEKNLRWEKWGKDEEWISPDKPATIDIISKRSIWEKYEQLWRLFAWTRQHKKGKR